MSSCRQQSPETSKIAICCCECLLCYIRQPPTHGRGNANDEARHFYVLSSGLACKPLPVAVMTISSSKNVWVLQQLSKLIMHRACHHAGTRRCPQRLADSA